MRTDAIQAVLRPRTGLEAVDLGFRLARAWWRPLAVTWLAFVLPVALAVVLALRAHPVWATLLLWWLRPAFARVPLHVLGGALFGATPGLADTAAALPRLLRSGLGTSLVLQRVSPLRTMLQPVLQLEGLRGAARRQRCRLLARQDSGAAAALAAACFHLTPALAVGLLFGLEMAIPEELQFDLLELIWPAFRDATADPGQLLLPLGYLAAISVVEPLQVAAGFALYLNRRVELEGWDLELAFRTLAQRSAATRSRVGPRQAAALLLAALAGAGVPQRASAGEDPCAAGDPSGARACIEAILADPAFGAKREVSEWVPRDFGGADSFSLDWLAWLPGALGALAELLLWATLAAAIVALIVALARSRRPATRARATQPPAPTTLFGLDLDPRALPADIVAAARARWAAGAPIEALSLLYRGAIVRLVARGALAIAPGATEFECVGLVRASQPGARAQAFATLTEAWLLARYAHRPPSAAAFAELCRDFASAFEAPPPDASGFDEAPAQGAPA